MAVANNGRAGEYIVVYRDRVSLSTRLEAEANLGIEPQEVFRKAFKGFVAELDREAIRRLEADERVLLIERDRKVKTQVNGPQNRSPVSSWGLDRLDQRYLPLDNRLATDSNGAGVEAYILDTGIRPDHSEFTGRINPDGFTSISDDNGWSDCDGHGTHVAGTVAGKTYGVASAARLTSVRVLDCEGSGSYSGVISGIEWMIADHLAGDPAVANMSLGGPVSEAINLAAQAAVDDGISLVVAAGNEATNACNRSPASAPAAVTVGSVKSNDALSDFSNTGSCVDVYAPGSEIKSAWHTSASATNTISGTSMAAPHAAGVAALHLSRSPGLSPGEISDRLVSTATPGNRPIDPGCRFIRILYVGSSPVVPEPATPPPPANDDFANRETLSGSVIAPRTFSSVCATAETGEAGHGAPPYDYRPETSVWFRWTAPASGNLILEADGPDLYPFMSAYTGSSVEQLTLITRNDPFEWVYFGDRSIRIPVSSGITYSIAIDSHRGRSGSITLSGAFTPGSPANPHTRPSNDNLHGAVVVSGSSFSSPMIDGDGATAQLGEPNHATWWGGGPFGSLWYRWTSPGPGLLELAASGEYDFAVYSGSSISTLVRESPADWGWEFGDNSRMLVRRGVNYSIALDTWPQAEGWTSIRGEFTPAPPNDAFANPTRITSFNSSINVVNEAASGQEGEPSHSEDQNSDSGPHASLWYEFAPSSNGQLDLDFEDGQNDSVVAVYTGSSLDSLSRIPEQDPGWDESATVAVRAGVVYRIAVDAQSDDDRGSALLGARFRAAPANDDFAGAEDLSLLRPSIEGTTVGATVEEGEPSHTAGGGEGPYGSVWYRWKAPAGGLMRIVSTASEADVDISVYQGSSISTLTRVGSDSWEVFFRARAGDTYWVAVDPWFITDRSAFSLQANLRINRPRILSGPPRKSRSGKARFVFAGEPNATYQCRITGQYRWSRCSQTETYRNLNKGRNLLKVRQVIGPTSVSPAASYSWFVTGR